MPAKIRIEKGQKFGRWTVIEPDVYNPNSKSKVKINCCLCECSCENKTQKYVATQRLRTGASQSCGCLRSELLAQRNMNNSSVHVGNRYGKLVVIQDLGLRKQQSRDQNERWSLCQCDCGSPPIEVKNNMLQSGWKKSCGCLQSQGEFVVEKLLSENNVQFIKEYYFSDLYVKSASYPLRFDFAVFNQSELQYLIEFDGRQHYDGPEAKWTSGHSLEEIQFYDSLKNEYCNNHNYPLIRIPYTHLENLSIEDLLLETSSFIVHK